MPAFTSWRLFESGATLDLGDLKINSFSVPHDAYDPVGFMFYHALGNIGFLTDLGYATKLVIERVRQARALVLEANHDLRLLQEDTKRPWSVKQRILSRHGHLSNDAAAEVAAEVVTDVMEDLYLGHLSADCNRPHTRAPPSAETRKAAVPRAPPRHRARQAVRDAGVGLTPRIHWRLDNNLPLFSKSP